MIGSLFGLGAPPLDDARWVILDVETSGLDPSRDRLLAIAALAVHLAPGRGPALPLADSFELVLRQPQEAALQPPDRPNILLHGIGLGAQQRGVGRREALLAFGAYVGQAPLLAFHAAFDRTLIERAFDAEGLAVPPNPWLDLAPLAAVLRPDIRARSLDEWLAALQIRCAVRHQAAADTLATAELLLKLWPALRAQHPEPRFADAHRLAALRRWLPP